MSKVKNLEARYEPDEKVAIHENAVIQIIQRVATHDAGIAELVKNSCDAYSEADALAANKMIVIILKNMEKDASALIGCLDFVGMTTDKIESRFKQWGDPDAAGGQMGKRKGGHGHGGKAYMVNMFKDHALIVTCSGGYGNRYGFLKGKILPGYFPDRAQGRRFPVPDKEKLLEQNLLAFSVKVNDLPPEAKASLAAGVGFTLVKGVDPKDLPSGKLRIASLIEDLQGHPQMIEAIQEVGIFVMADGKPVEKAWPLKLEPIEPMGEAKEPKEFIIPENIPYPTSKEAISTIDDPKSQKGKLVLRTSQKSMMWGIIRSRHRIYIHARDEYIGSWDVRDLAGKGFADQIYGDLYLDSFLQYKTSDRVEPANSLLTQAVKEWVRQAIEKYCLEFIKLEKLKATQKERDEWQRISERMNQWKNKFLKNLGLGAGGMGGSSGKSEHRQALPRGQVARLHVSLTHAFSGVGIAIQPTIEFHDAAGQRVRSIPYRWNSSDWNIATVDEDLFRVLTHSPGITEVWAETIEGKIMSNKVQLTVLDIKSIIMEEEMVELNAGRFKPLGTAVEDREGKKYDGVYLNWISDNNEVVRVGPAGVVWAIAKGNAEVTAGDDRALASPGTIVKVLEGVGPGKQKGRGFPEIRLSGIDVDPYEPDKTPEQFLTRRHPPIYQRVFPDDVEAQIWWINMAAPLANRYWLEASGQAPTSDKVRQWRVYYLERIIEAMVKIRLYIEYKFEGNTSWDLLKERWDDMMILMQEAMASDLEQFLENGVIPGPDE